MGFGIKWEHFLPRALLVAVATSIIAFVLGFVLSPVNQWLGAWLGGALTVLVALMIFLLALSVHPGKEDFIQLLILVAVATIALKAISSFVNIPLLAFSFNFAGDLGVMFVSLAVVLLGDTVAMMLMNTKRPVTG